MPNQVEKLMSIGGALYWDPVDQLTLGWGVGWNKQEDDDGCDCVYRTSPPASAPGSASSRLI